MVKFAILKFPLLSSEYNCTADNLFPISRNSSPSVSSMIMEELIARIVPLQYQISPSFHSASVFPNAVSISVRVISVSLVTVTIRLNASYDTVALAIPALNNISMRTIPIFHNFILQFPLYIIK